MSSILNIHLNYVSDRIFGMDNEHKYRLTNVYYGINRAWHMYTHFSGAVPTTLHPAPMDAVDHRYRLRLGCYWEIPPLP